MNKWLKVFIWVFGVFIGLLLIVWGVLYYYVYYNKKPLLEKISTEVNEMVNGNLSIGDLDLTFWRDFPEVSLRLTDVMLTDSLYDDHGRALISAGEIFVKMNFPSVFTSISEVEKVSIVNTKFHLFTDSNGYTNQYLINFKKAEKEIKETKKREIYVFFANLENFHLLIENVPGDKKFDVNIENMEAAMVNTDTSIGISAPLSAQIGQLGFNLEKGPFLVDKHLEAQLNIHYHKFDKVLALPLQKLKVEDEEVQLSMRFEFLEKPGKYQVEIYDDNINYQTGLSFLNQHIVKRLSLLNLKKPATVRAELRGTFMKKDKPWVKVDFNSENNYFETDYGDIDSATFSGYYFNNWEDGLGHVDSNSVIFIDSILGKYNGNLPFRGDSILVHNFKKTHIKAKIGSTFNVTALNDLIGNSIQFSKGDAKLQLQFDGHIGSKVTTKRNLTGFIQVNKGKMFYGPRNLAFDNIDFDLRFTGQDLELKKINLSRGRTNLHVDGSAKNFMNAYFDNPEKILINANVSSDFLNLNDFMALLANPEKKKVTSSRVKKRKMIEMNRRIDQILTQGNMHLHIKVKDVVKDNFTANNLVADVDLLTNKILINRASVNHAKGSLHFKGSILQGSTNNPFQIDGKIDKVRLEEFLYAFDNFGMKSVTHENIKGNFSSNIDIAGNFTDGGELLKRSIKGQVKFKLSNAAFINFYPFTEIKKYVFRSRNLDSITFFDIENNLIIDDGKVMIFPMEIRNNALNVFVKGIYAFDKGTDLSIEIPLSNPKKDNERVLAGQESKRKGMKVFLRAQDDENGNVKISWDYNKKGSDVVDAKLHLTEDGELFIEDENGDTTVISREELMEKIEVDNKRSNFFSKMKQFYLRTIQDSGKVK